MLGGILRSRLCSVAPQLRRVRQPVVCTAVRTYLDASEFLEEKEELNFNVDAKKLPRAIKVKNRFHSPWDPYATKKSFIEFLYWMYTRTSPRVIPSAAEAHKYLPIRNVDLTALAPSNQTKLTWVRIRNE